MQIIITNLTQSTNICVGFFFSFSNIKEKRQFKITFLSCFYHSLRSVNYISKIQLWKHKILNIKLLHAIKKQFITAM